MGRIFATIIGHVYDSKRREFFGRDGSRWGKLAMFYFFFYSGLAGFFSFMVFVLMTVTPLDRPRYYGEASCMQARSKPLSPGLGFRPQMDTENSIIVDQNNLNLHVKNLHQYLTAHYWTQDSNQANHTNKFTIPNPGDCTIQNQYGFANRKPCVLIKMNKIIGFEPKPGYLPTDESAYKAAGCRSNPNAISIHCTGEFPADVDQIQNITYISENGYDTHCGSLETKWFPYRGKKNRQDIYQAPYMWVQFNDVKPHVIIHVVCRAFASNVIIEKLPQLGAIRFNLYINETSFQS